MFSGRRLKTQEELDVDDTSLPRRQKLPRRYEKLAEAEFHYDPKSMYHQHHYEAFNLAIISIKTRFEQLGYKTFSNIEQLLIKSCVGENADVELKAVCDFFGDDFEEAALACELQILRELFTQKGGSAASTTAVLRDVRTSLTASQGDLISSVWRLYQLLLVLPATNVTSERTFSALRRVKSYLRSIMAQA